jgi:hypothetical protein
MLISNAINQIGAITDIIDVILESLSESHATFSLPDGLSVTYTYNCDAFSIESDCVTQFVF